MVKNIQKESSKKLAARQGNIKGMVEVVNIVVSSSLEHDIPLEKMAATLSNTEYNPEQFDCNYGSND